MTQSNSRVADWSFVLFPILFAFIVIGVLHVSNVSSSKTVVVEYVENGSKQHFEDENNSDVQHKLEEAQAAITEYKKYAESNQAAKENGKGDSVTGSRIFRATRSILVINMVVIAIAISLPFLIYHISPRVRWDENKRISAGIKRRFQSLSRIPVEQQQARANNYLQLIFVRTCVALIIGISWVYHLCPYGQRTTYFLELSRRLGFIHQPSNPISLEPNNGPMIYVLAGLMGWYIHLLTTAIYRAQTGDIISHSIFFQSIRRFLLVIGICVVLGVTKLPGSIAIAFLVGVFPTSGVQAITNLFQIATVFPAGPHQNLLIIKSLPFFKSVRLSEEGIQDLSDLSRQNADYLYFVTGIPKQQLSDWIDAARLASVVGSTNYIAMSGLCCTADHFLEESSDSDFEQELRKLNILNAGEIRKRLEELQETS